MDDETGLYYMNARYYEPETGRFISQDTYRGEGEGFWHLYLYCDSDPVNNIDPTGHWDTDEIIKNRTSGAYVVKFRMCAEIDVAEFNGKEFYRLSKVDVMPTLLDKTFQIKELNVMANQLGREKTEQGKDVGYKNNRKVWPTINSPRSGKHYVFNANFKYFISPSFGASMAVKIELVYTRKYRNYKHSFSYHFEIMYSLPDAS